MQSGTGGGMFGNAGPVFAGSLAKQYSPDQNAPYTGVMGDEVFNNPYMSPPPARVPGQEDGEQGRADTRRDRNNMAGPYGYRWGIDQ